MTDAAQPQYKGPQRVFSGMQPTNGLHLGNYLGALQKWVKLQDSYECIYCVVDLHAITTGPDPENLASRCREVAAAYVAAGVDPRRSIIFVQSAVREHTELAWIFNCVARMGWVERMTQFKDKAGKDAQRSSVGLFDYPRSEEHTSELQSRENLVCRLLLEKKKNTPNNRLQHRY